MADADAFVVTIARRLRRLGMAVGVSSEVDAALAIRVGGAEDPAALRSVLRTVFAKSPEEVRLVDSLLDGLVPGEAGDGTELGEEDLQGAGALALDPAGGSSPENAPADGQNSVLSYSAAERLRERDFVSLDADEERELRSVLRQERRLPRPASRRRRRAAHGRFDARRTMRRAAGTGGEVFHRVLSTRRPARRRIVLLCDVSGSMRPYAMFTLLFADVLARTEDVRVFAFSTRLTALNAGRRRGTMSDLLNSSAPDAGGGTRIGASLATFNRVHARRLFGRRGDVAIVSDGFDRGEPEVLERELKRLRRHAHRLVWVNPLLGRDSYRPETRGMAAALPLLDNFVAGHTLGALDEAMEVLARA